MMYSCLFFGGEPLLVLLAYVCRYSAINSTLQSAFWDTVFASKLRNRDSRVFFIAFMGELKTLIRRQLRWFGGACRRGGGGGGGGGSVGMWEAFWGLLMSIQSKRSRICNQIDGSNKFFETQPYRAGRQGSSAAWGVNSSKRQIS